jgi:hypothetical protein
LAELRLLGDDVAAGELGDAVDGDVDAVRAGEDALDVGDVGRAPDVVGDRRFVLTARNGLSTTDREIV